MKIKKILFAIILFLISCNFVFAEEDNVNIIVPLQDAFIRYHQIGSQAYEFYVVTNLPPERILRYDWFVDNKENYRAEKLNYFFTKGEHNVRVKVEDEYGNVRYDKVKLTIDFWSLQNNWLLWILYLLLCCVLIYYWMAKLIYLFNRSRVNREVRYFLSAMEEHGWLERALEEMNRKNNESFKKNPNKNYHI
ncbi:hypothetical protein KKC32_00910 [Patescibacteria group bacterium]|nr:hypothetical protein [Patescibacteria group bacterium]